MRIATRAFDARHLSRSPLSKSSSSSFLILFGLVFVVLFGSCTTQILAAADINDDDPTNLLVWESRAALPLGVGRHHPITFANATHGFVLTGSTLQSSYTSDFFIYEVATNKWTDVSNTNSAFPGIARSFGYGVTATSNNCNNDNDSTNTKAYLGFGAGDSGQRFTDWWEFDMSTHNWKRLAEFPGNGRKHPAINFVEPVGEIHVGLGDGNGGNYNDWWSYSIANDEWQQLADFPSSPRHHPFYFSIDTDSYVGFGHSSSYIERDLYRYDSLERTWNREEDFASYALGGDINSTDTFSSAIGRNSVALPVTTEARVAGTQFAITGSCNNSSDNQQTYGFILSGDGDDHGYMETGEFHVFNPMTSEDEYSPAWYSLPPHPGFSRWAPGSFVLQGSSQVYMIGGYDRRMGILYADMWTINLDPLFDDDGGMVSDDATNDIYSSSF